MDAQDMYFRREVDLVFVLVSSVDLIKYRPHMIIQVPSQRPTRMLQTSLIFILIWTEKDCGVFIIRITDT